jgi:glyoxylase-like metal-dependent hydrolase (beta-lactamase superfamily II)
MATVDVILEGYARPGDEGSHVAGTVSLVRSGDLVAIVDPGMAVDRGRILGPLADLGVAPEDVTDVVLSHHHPDHTVNIALFPRAAVHDTWATYRGDLWVSRPAEGFELAEGVVLWETPGHTPQDISTVVTTADGVVVCTHLWWHAEMEGDPRATDMDQLHAGRARVLDVATRIVPGHGPAFDVTEATPR